MSKKPESQKTPGPAQGQTAGQVADQVLRMQATRVLVVGDLILDQYIAGDVSRISPEAPVPVVVESGRRAVLGGAANVAANIARFGAECTLIGRIGTDADGADLTAACKAQGIDTRSLVTSRDLPTTRKLRVLAGYQQIVRIDRESLAQATDAEVKSVQLSIEKFAATPGHRAIVISDYGKGFCTEAMVRCVITTAGQHGIPVITDPKSPDLSRYRGSMIIKPNRGEGREALRRKSPGVTFENADAEALSICETVLAESGARNIVLSLSERGVIAKGSEITGTVRFRTAALQVADVSGAGDTMIAFLAMGAAAGLDFERSVLLANTAAGIVCGKLGTATVSSHEFVHAFNAGNPAGGVVRPEKTVTLPEITRLAAEYRRDGREIVFTNGCFDLLHAGHVSLLQRARALGDVLVLGLNTDASVRRLKGETRPVQSEGDRASILSGLACVDFVVLFDSDTPLDFIRAIRPHVLVKGGDYRPDQVVGAPDMAQWGGRTTILPLIEGRSTTGIIARMEDKRGQPT